VKDLAIVAKCFACELHIISNVLSGSGATTASARGLGKTRQWRVARRLSDESYAFNREIVVPRNVAAGAVRTIVRYNLY